MYSSRSLTCWSVLIWFSDCRPVRYIGFVIWLGPILADQVWFDGFKSVPGLHVAGAIGFFRKTDYPYSAVNNVTDMRFGFADKVSAITCTVLSGNIVQIRIALNQQTNKTYRQIVAILNHSNIKKDF